VSLVLLLVVLAVIGGIAVVATGRWGGLPDVEPERSPRGELPADVELDRPAVDGLRFSLALRGYRMDEVDDVLDRLVDELDRRGERISELEARLADEARIAEED
jgi:DivIVA domain-containing protein